MSVNNKKGSQFQLVPELDQEQNKERVLKYNK